MDDAISKRAKQRLEKFFSERYRISRLIGIGGMASVYAGVHRNGHAVAIKILHDRLSADPDVERLFRREALMANTIRHPGIVPVIDDDTTEDGCIFLVMPLLQGETLRTRAARTGNVLPLEEVARVAHTMLDILEAAHAIKIVHRDIKPDNVFVTCEGEVRVLDFGIARFFETNESSSLTRSGRATGTPAYMAPEQALGRVRTIDGRTDLWSVGATMFTLLSGQTVHAAESSAELLVLAATRPPRALEEVAPAVPEAFREVVDRALCFDKAARWPDAASMKAALVRACKSVFGVVPTELAQLEVPRFESTADIFEVTTHRSDPLALRTTEPVASSALRSHPSHDAMDIASAAKQAASGRGWRWSRGARIATLVGALAVGVGGAAVGLPRWWGGASVQNAHTVDATAVDEHLVASRNAWLDGAIERARAEASEVLRVNPSSAGANLAMIRTTDLWPTDEDRSRFVKAQEGRQSLTASERAYLEALAPGMSVPANFALSVERLEAIHQRSPDILEVTIALAQNAMRINRSERAIALLDSVARASETPGIVLAFLGAALGYHDDVDTARATFQRCVANYPAASLCSMRLTYLELFEGRCADAERAARQDLEANPKNARAYLRLASAIESQGAATREIHPVLQKWATLSDKPGETVNALDAELTLALLDGRLRDALDIDKKIDKALLGTESDSARYLHALGSMFLKNELGMSAAACDVLSEYKAFRQGLRRSVYTGDNALTLHAYAVRLGLVPWNEWLELRNTRLATSVDRDHILDGPQRIWLEFFARPATTPETARDALDVLPKYLPILHRTDRRYKHDASIGTALRLAGRPQEALPYFERAMAACTRMDNPIEHTHMLMEFAALLEELHERDRACTLYRKVLHSWPEASGSRSSALAAQRETVVCPRERPSSSAVVRRKP